MKFCSLYASLVINLTLLGSLVLPRNTHGSLSVRDLHSGTEYDEILCTRSAMRRPEIPADVERQLADIFDNKTPAIAKSYHDWKSLYDSNSQIQAGTREGQEKYESFHQKLMEYRLQRRKETEKVLKGNSLDKTAWGRDLITLYERELFYDQSVGGIMKDSKNPARQAQRFQLSKDLEGEYQLLLDAVLRLAKEAPRHSPPPQILQRWYKITQTSKKAQQKSKQKMNAIKRDERRSSSAKRRKSPEREPLLRGHGSSSSHVREPSSS